MTALRHLMRRFGPLLVGVLASAATFGLATTPASAAPTPLVGTFTITAGSCSGGVASGTYLRMVLSGGSNATGPYFSNSDSSCSDDSYTPLAPGSAGGLSTTGYQPQPSPAFDGSGNALANQITAPVAFEGVKFATATNPVDPQTGTRVAVPAIAANGSSLSGTLEAFGVSWNNQEFNQGSPKPGGSTPGNTTPVTGTYDAASGLYTLQWSSQVVGGPFNGFSAFWHLTGKFVPASGGASVASGSSTATSSPKSTGVVTQGSTGSTAHATPTTSPAASGGATGASSTTTSVPAAGQSTTAPSSRPDRVVLSSRTTSSGGGGWNTPTWLIVLVSVLAALGLFGVVWSERTLRKQGEMS